MVKNSIRCFSRTFFAVMSCTLFVGSVSAAIYKTVDEEGNVVFSDSAPAGESSEEVKLKPLTPIPSPQSGLNISKPKPEEQKIIGYKKLEIVEPTPGATIQNQDSFNVRIALAPGIQPGHRIRLLLNGKRIGESSGQLSFTASNVERGSQVLTAEILDANSKVIKSAKSTVFVHRAIARPVTN
ncbi:DUF4124 domain-containing protein [uncultured Endozoicomonas sp.]|uniref:DUF4124 domain-containing protein n=1 Tax=uncultured Endozoicomonas sp. TaxID=432652 RepID=UPI0026091DED|nr:DUF4124 domain-containing protein [uncultured Endozoicomonas sp.]